MSYTWRSILAGLDLLKKGVVWRVGGGTDIRIWEDAWIPRDESRWPFTPRGTNLLSHVDELIHPHTGSWDEALVRDIFWEEDADYILCIPIHEGMEDLIAWHFNTNGQFTVLSAYKVFMTEKRRSVSFPKHYAGAPRAAGGPLTAAFTESEALTAVRAMNANSAPGPDGVGPGFYKAAWAAVKNDVVGTETKP